MRLFFSSFFFEEEVCVELTATKFSTLQFTTVRYTGGSFYSSFLALLPSPAPSFLAATTRFRNSATVVASGMLQTAKDSAVVGRK